MKTDHSISQDDPLVLVYLRNEFYKKKFYWVSCIFMLSVIGIIVLSSMLYYLLGHPRQPLYFIADPVTRLQQDVPLADPNMTLDEVIAWTTTAIQAAYTYDYTNYRAQLQSAQKYFTNYGWTKYMQGLRDSNNLTALTERHYIQVGVVVEKPQVLVQGHMGSTYAYRLRMPVLMTYWAPPYDDKSKIFNPLMVTVIVQRQSLLSSQTGLGIVQMNAELILSSPSP